jgi:CrcB protein
MTKVIFIALGGALGSLTRYGVAGFVQRNLSGGSLFPVGTLAVNGIGCLVMGFLGAALAGSIQVREEIRVGVLVGVLGGFTTFSAFAWETHALMRDHQFAHACLNLLLSNGISVTALWIGYRLASHWIGV